MPKKPIAYIVDSTAHISHELANHPDLYVVPLNVHFGDNEYADGVGIRPEELYEKIRTSTELPKTSQPSAGRFTELFDRLKEEYEQGIAVVLSGEMSGTYASAVSGADLSGFDVRIVDGKSLSYGTTGLVRLAMELGQEGKKRDDIVDAISRHIGKGRSYIYIGQLNQLHKGGRMGSVQFYLGSMLQIKPIIQITPEGTLDVTDKVRSEKKAFRYLVDKVKKAYDEGRRTIHLMHADSPGEADRLKAQMLEAMPDLIVKTGDIGAVLAVHAGEGTMAVIWYDFD
ncbi:DegV family protein [Bhargavaea ginsengi]|uniref:DegV family protein n=1 Tax=Bhargavaea ginsengi TaxID=426757 RepID=UPI00203AC8C8|nr:DegV family protein [Bhargavaea ginsengi]MCM3087094.1 DegV family protein [Bhargavaea ginsengi]